MRDFSWHVFTRTGNVQAYLLYKESEATQTVEHTNQYSTFSLEQEHLEYAHQVDKTL